MARPTPARTLDLRPGALDLCLYHGTDDPISVYRRDQATGATLPLTGWSTPTAYLRPARGAATGVDLVPVINVDRVDITITAAMKTALGVSRGVWEVDILDDTGARVTLVQGAVTIDAEVVTA